MAVSGLYVDLAHAYVVWVHYPMEYSTSSEVVLLGSTTTLTTLTGTNRYKVGQELDWCSYGGLCGCSWDEEAHYE